MFGPRINQGGYCMQLKSLKGKVLKANIELWENEINPPCKYTSAQGVIDFVITRNVASWVAQGLIEIYEDSKDIPEGEEPKAKEVVDLAPIAAENTEITEEKEIEAEVEAVKQRRRTKRK